MPDRDRLKLLNKLCKTCSRNRVIPKSMHIPDCSEGSVEVECGGFANVSRSAYEGRLVGVKAVRVYVTSDLDVILSVSPLPVPSHPSVSMNRSDSVVKLLLGNICGIPISCRSLE